MDYLYKSPIGYILFKGNEKHLTNLDFISDADALAHIGNAEPKGELLKAVTEIDEYFNKTRQTFTVKLHTDGTPFRKRVWEALSRIPYGETISYKQLAANVGNPKASRAVGGANHNNPVSIIVPCHRVIGANGQLTGYGGEIWRKEWLINHEKG